MVKPEIVDQYQPTIGIECHVQLNTKTKLFSGASNDDRGKEPNTVVSPICFGLPGTLPVLNEKAVELAARAGFALQAEVAKISSFDRKHYFYPDLPKGYQITQLHRPIIIGGKVEIVTSTGKSSVRIHHAHLEEDAGKSTHPSGADYSLVDLNRAGTPLLEIVSEPDMHSAAEAKAYVQELYLLMKYAGVTLGDLQHGNMRFDVNISVAKKDAKEWGTRAEVKNLNSFRAVERAVEFEMLRQIELIEKGEKVKQETRGWDEAKQKTISQRSKEEAQDYRYFPEPDLPPTELTDQQIADYKKEMPALPTELRSQIEQMGIQPAAAETLILQDALHGRGYVLTVLHVGKQAGNDAAKFTANFLVNRDVKDRPTSGEVGVIPSVQQFMDVYNMTKAGELSSNNADNLLYLFRDGLGEDARQTAIRLEYIQENNEQALSAIIDAVLADPANQKAVADIKGGEPKAVGFLVGQVMKASKGKANPAVVSSLLRKQLGE
jgi:aspartyl-tRNA(Asn)/glutamyl-tRNA(Gln) amidotransferase subunit B